MKELKPSVVFDTECLGPSPGPATGHGTDDTARLDIELTLHMNKNGELT
jgi:hypothetical protein